MEMAITLSNFDSILCRLLSSATETNYTALEQSLLRSQLYKNCLPVRICRLQTVRKTSQMSQKIHTFVCHSWREWNIGLRFRAACCVLRAALESSRIPAINKLNTDPNLLAQGTLPIKSAEKSAEKAEQGQTSAPCDRLCVALLFWWSGR